MSVEIGNPIYFAMLIVLFAGTLALLFLFRRLPKRAAFVFCMTLVWVNFALHYLKQLSPYYMADWPYSLRTSTGENLCALTIMLSPFVYLFGPKVLKSYTLVISIISGLAVYFAPTTAVGRPLSEMENLLEVMRFYFCHFPLFAVPVILLDRKIFEIRPKDSFVMAFFFMGHMALVTLNEVFLKASGLTEATWLDILSRDYRNGAFSNGPTSGLDFLSPYLYWALPHFYIDGVLYFVPALWAALPLIIFAPLIGLGFSAFFDPRSTKAALRGMKVKYRQMVKERKAQRAYV